MQKYSPGSINLGKVAGKPPGNQGQSTVYKLRVPRNLVKRYNVIKIKAPRPIKFGEIKEASMVRKTKKQVYVEEDSPIIPTHGAGSVYNYERKEEARKKRRGYIQRTINVDDLPYALRIGGKGGKRYTGKKEPILEHSSYYILTQCPDGVFEAVPVQAWYNFMPDIDYATLTSDEVEHEFSKRDRSLSYFTKKYNFGIGDLQTDDYGKVRSTDDDHGLMIHDDLDLSDDDLDELSGDEKPTKKNQKKEKDLFRGKKKDRAGSDKGDSDEEETFENFESKEVDYMSETSSEDELAEMDDEPDPEKENAGKAKDDINLFGDTDEEEEEEEEKELNEAGKELKAMLKKENGGESSAEEDDDEEEEEDEDIDNEFSSSAVFMQGKDSKKKKGRSGSGSGSKPSSRSNTPIQPEQSGDSASQGDNAVKEGKHGTKRSHDTSSPAPHSKKQKVSGSTHSESPKPSSDALRTNSPAFRPVTPSDSGNGITEESIRRYLTHKPMTTTDLMRKFKTKKTGLSKEQTVNAIATILKKIQPHQEKIDGKLYLSIKTKK